MYMLTAIIVYFSLAEGYFEVSKAFTPVADFNL